MSRCMTTGAMKHLMSLDKKNKPTKDQYARACEKGVFVDVDDDGHYTILWEEESRPYCNKCDHDRSTQTDEQHARVCVAEQKKQLHAQIKRALNAIHSSARVYCKHCFCAYSKRHIMDWEPRFQAAFLGVGQDPTNPARRACATCQSCSFGNKENRSDR